MISEYVPRVARPADARHLPGWRKPSEGLRPGLGVVITALSLILAAVPGFAAARTLTLAAWNIEHLAAEDGQGCRARDAAEYEAIRKYLQRAGADVIAFQEVENLSAARRVFPAADYDVHISARPTREFPECYDHPRNRLMQRTGFAVRKDIGARLGLKVVRQPDVKELQGGHDTARWGVYLTLERAGAGRGVATPAMPPLHLLSIHLKSRCTYQSLTGKKAGSHCRILHEQVGALSDWINARARRQQDFIIAGDFNRQLDQLSDEVWLRLESGGGRGDYVDLEKALHGIKHPQPYRRKYPFAIDHVIYNQALDNLAVEAGTFFDIEAGKYSDHLPLFATFDLSG